MVGVARSLGAVDDGWGHYFPIIVLPGSAAEGGRLFANFFFQIRLLLYFLAVQLLLVLVSQEILIENSTFSRRYQLSIVVNLTTCITI